MDAMVRSAPSGEERRSQEAPEGRIVDGATVYTGSYNWSKSAEKKNTELMLEFRAPPAVREFVREFCRPWDSEHAVRLPSAATG